MEPGQLSDPETRGAKKGEAWKGHQTTPSVKECLFDSMMEHLPIRIYFKDLQSRFIYGNRAYSELFNLVNFSEIQGHTDFDFFSEEHACAAFEDEQEIIRSGEAKLNMEEKETWPDGHVTWCSTSKAPLRDDQGRSIGTFGISQDITAQKKAEAALKESEYLFRESQRAAAIGSYKLDLAHGTWESSEVLDKIWGIGKDFDRTLQGWLALVHPEDRAMMDQYLRLDAVADGKPLSREYRIVRKCDCASRWVHIVGEVLSGGDNSVLFLIGTVQDITERKTAEQEKIILESKLQQSQRMEGLGLFAAGVAHNINNIMTIILGTASLGEQRASEASDQESYRTVGLACKRGRDVLKSLIQFGKPNLAKRVPFELNALIEEVVLLFKSTARDRVQVSTIYLNEPLWMQGDSSAINHALLNLFLNALEAMANGGTLTLRTALHETDWVEVSVEDKGIGMTPEVLAHVLEPFFTTKAVDKGTGLGLSMTYGVVNAHGGVLELFSQPGQGTTVKMRFPRIPAPVPSTPSSPLKASLGNMKIFLADDDAEVRSLMKLMIKAAGVDQVNTFSGGEKLLAGLRSGELPDLVILDQNMPGMDGVQALVQIRDLYPNLPVLIASGQSDIEEWDCFKRPLVGAISKPFSLEEIQTKLAQLLG